jgi:hypothetical protein
MSLAYVKNRSDEDDANQLNILSKNMSNSYGLINKIKTDQ